MSKKNIGQVFTKSFTVNMILDYVGYNGSGIIGKHIIDNSCGNGAFLSEIVTRYIIQCKESGMEISGIADNLSEYIHGIELDDTAYNACIKRLDDIAESFKISGVKWDVRNGNTLFIHDYDGRMDYVVGNPPYVRIHNIDNESLDAVHNLYFSGDGMTDLYLAFYEIGIDMMNDDGKLCYVAPSSWLSSSSGENMRKYLSMSHRLSGVIDFGHIQIFDNATAYVMIVLIDNCQHESVSYSVAVDGGTNYKFMYDINYNDMFINGNIVFCDDSIPVRDIMREYEKMCVVKNGLATLADDVFIDNLPELSGYTIDVVKASTGIWKKCLFPYKNTMEPVSLDELRFVGDVYDYIMMNEERLRSRAYDGELWYLIGRTQGLNDVYRDKIAVNCIIRNVDDIKMCCVPEGSGVYSGLYIISDISYKRIESIIKSDDFIRYVKTLRKYKSGGYYTFSAGDLEKYLNWKLSLDNGENLW